MFRKTVVGIVAAVFALPAGAALPGIVAVKSAHSRSDVLLLDRHGEVIHELRVDSQIRRLEWVPLSDISPALLKAVIQAEDRRFYDHAGVDWRALAGSAITGLWRDNPRGASTITMQLAARLDSGLQPISMRRSLGQKWRQLQLARELERSWTKAEILEAYLNLVDFRGELRGVAAAARGLFDKRPSGLDEREALILAALLRAPGSSAGIVATRACALAASLNTPFSCESIASSVTTRLAGPLSIRPAAANAPHAARILYRQGVNEMTSTLDAELQRLAQQVLAQQLGALGPASRVRDGAVLVVDNKSGEVLAYVGNNSNGFVDGVIAPRQAGSTLKPFLYELAIERRLLTAASVLDDSPINLATPTGLYVPQDYDKDFKGPITLRASLGSSINVPAVRTLMLVGADNFVLRLRRLGFSDITENGAFYGYSLALGSAEVNLWQLVNAYRTLSNGGVYSPLTLTPGVKLKSERLFDRAAAFVVSDILSDRAARSFTFGFENVLATPFWSAVKTGTSKDMRDNWCVGFSDRFTVGVWVGNFNGESMQDVSGVTGAAPVWFELMRYLHQGRAVKPPVPPSGVVASEVRFSPEIESARREWFLNGTQVSDVTLQSNSAVRRARILYPSRGTVLALDPDIPPGVQRVFLEMTSDDQEVHWQLDGLELDAAAGWVPTFGRHQLALVDRAGVVRDEVSFEVRGGAY